MKSSLAVSIGALKLKNPVMVGSGTFGYAEEFSRFMPLKKLGAIVTKTITLEPRQGNPPPRTSETPAGMLNSIGLENPGIEVFIKEKIPYLKKIGVPVIISIASEASPEEFVYLARKLDKVKGADAFELNISCPNIRSHAGGMRPLISQDPLATYEVVKRVRKVTGKPLITKLSPNVASISEIALAAQKAGSDAVSLINTLTGMSIDTRTKRPKLAAVTGGVSGPAIRPVAVRMVWEVYRKVTIPIIGMGGIVDTQSALEFFIAGATAVSIGTGNFINPAAPVEVIRGLETYLNDSGYASIKDITGSLQL